MSGPTKVQDARAQVPNRTARGRQPNRRRTPALGSVPVATTRTNRAKVDVYWGTAKGRDNAKRRAKTPEQTN